MTASKRKGLQNVLRLYGVGNRLLGDMKSFSVNSSASIRESVSD